MKRQKLVKLRGHYEKPWRNDINSHIRRFYNEVINQEVKEVPTHKKVQAIAYTNGEYFVPS